MFTCYEIGALDVVADYDYDYVAVDGDNDAAAVVLSAWVPEAGAQGRS